MSNISAGLAPFCSWGKPLDNIYLSPMVGLSTFALALTGLFSTTKGFFASRNAIASCFIVFAVVLSGLNPDSSLLLIIPLAILIAHGLRYLLEKWYGLFPENPYARVFALFPLSVLLALIIIPNLTYFIYGYRYTPAVANNFNNDLSLVIDNLDETCTLVTKEDSLDFEFYEAYIDRTHRLNLATDASSLNAGATVASFGKLDGANLELKRIITSPKSDNSDRI